MKTLIIHHLQEIWEQGLNNLGTDFETELNKVMDHLENNHYNKIIVTNFEAGFNLDPAQEPLNLYCPTVYDYCYGWDTEMAEQDPTSEYCDGGNHSEKVLIDTWMKDLRGEVFICGAFDGECIEDLEIALSYCDIDFERINSLIN